MKYISLATKNAIIYFILAMAGIATLGYLLFRNSAAEIIESSERQIKHAGELVELKFVSFLKDAERDITYLAQSPYLHDYLKSIGTEKETEKKKLLANEYLALINSKPHYSQIRLIGLERKGKEIIRAERKSGSTFLVAEDSLQEKGNRNYFLETIALKKDSIYFSPIDLNKEFGKISIPPVPTLRTACPVFIDDTLFGIAVINVDLRDLFNELKLLVGTQLHLKMSNQDGHFLIHPDSAKTFTFEYNKNPGFQEEFNLRTDESSFSFLAENNSIIKEKEQFYGFLTVPYPRKDYFLITGIGAAEKEILQSFYKWRIKSLSITFGLALLIFVIALIYMRRQANELKHIIEIMTSFPKKMIPAKLPINRNDEIGQLAKSFEEMSGIISEKHAQLKKAKNKTEQAVKDKDAFLENMSHEIRNPLHSIIGMSHLLEKNNPGRHQQAFIESLKFNSKNLLSLVNDILDFKKLNTGEITISPEWISLPNLIAEISASQKFNAVSKKIKLDIDASPVLDQYLFYFDEVRLAQIINNLVINAIKFTKENGTVKIHSTIEKENKNIFKIRIAVQDNGIGIAPEEVDKILERHYTQHGPSNSNVPAGAGLGLPIVVQLLNLFDSKLNIESQLGTGSTFYFDLHSPGKVLEGKDNKKDIHVIHKILTDIDLLVIDDDEQILFLYESIFADVTRSLVKISNIADIELLNASSFDAIISDIYFKEQELHGFKNKVNKLLRTNGFLYIVSGSDKKLDNFLSSRKLFQKPINPSELLDHLAEDLATAKYGTPNLDSIWKDYDQDPIKFNKAIDLLIEEWEKMLFQIETALANNDPTKYDAICHKLITSVRRLKLNYFEEILNQPFIKEGDNDSVKSIADKINKMMTFYIWHLKKRINK